MRTRGQDGSPSGTRAGQPTMSYTALSARDGFAGSLGADDLPSNVASARFFAAQDHDFLGTLNSNLGETTFSSAVDDDQDLHASSRSTNRLGSRAGTARGGQDRHLVSSPLEAPPSSQAQTRLSSTPQNKNSAHPHPAAHQANSTGDGDKPMFKKIPLRGGAGAAGMARNERSSRAHNVFRMLGGHTGPVTSDVMVQELAETYTQRRQFMERASQMTSEMSARAADIAAIDEHNRQLGFKGDVAQLQATIENQLAEAERQKSQQRTTGSAQSAGDVDKDILFDANGTPENDSDVKAKAKLARLLKLRTMQRRIGELDDEAVEEEQRFVLAAKKRQQLQERGGYESRRGSVVSSTRSAAASPNASAGSPDGLKRTFSTHSAARLRTLQEPRITATELRQQFDALLDGDADSDAILPDPPRNFTSNSLAVTLEIVSQCLARIVAASDSVCISATFRGTDETVDIFYDLEKFRKNYEHALLCLDVAMGHLSHFEIGEKAMIEGGQFEVNSLREQFLVRKELLTAQEQKESTAEENCKALRLRLRKVRERIAMWDEVIFGHTASGLLPEDDMALGESVNRAAGGGGGRPGSQSLSLQHGAGKRHSTLNRVPDSSRGRVGSRSRRLVASGPRDALSSSSSSPIRLNTVLGDYLDRSGSTAAFPGSTTRAKPLAALYAETDVPLSAEDAMELRVARTWGNPYVTKALQYQQATHLMPLYQRQLEQQQQEGSSPERESSEMRPMDWAFRGNQADSASLTPPGSASGGAAWRVSGVNGGARLGVGNISLPSVLPPVVLIEVDGAPDPHEGLSIATTTTTNSEANTAAPAPGTTTTATSTDNHPLSARMSTKPPTQLPQPLAVPAQRFSLGRNTATGSVLHSYTAAPGGGAASLVSGTGFGIPSYSFCTDASRNTLLLANNNNVQPFMSQRIADERMLVLLQAMLRVVPTERNYIARFQQGMSDDDEEADGEGGSPIAGGSAGSRRTQPNSSAAPSPKAVSRPDNNGSKAAPRVVGQARALKGRALPRLVAYDIELSTEEKFELANCQATRVSVERLIQVLTARTKANAPRV